MIVSPRWRKITRDLWLNLPRTILVVLAIAIGVFGVGLVLDTYTILNRNIDANYKSANPPSATLWMDKADKGALDIARSFPGTADVDWARNPVRARVQTGPDQWDVLLLYVVDDFSNLKVGKFFSESGSWPPGDKQILIERASMPVIHGRVGEPITMRVINSDVHEVQVAGTVFDPSQDPGWVNKTAVGYVTPKTLEWLGGKPSEAGLRIVVSNDSQSRSYINNLAVRLGNALKQKGYTVKRIEVPVPGKYEQSDKSNSIISTLGIFGFLCLFLSGFITASLITSLLSQQVRQIGVMKALGANRHQVTGIYLGMVFCLSGVALIISIPLGVMIGRSFAFATLGMLNFNVIDGSVPAWAYLIQISLGILVPLVTAVYPISKGSRVTINEAIRDYGVYTKNIGSSRMDSLLKRLRGLPRPLTLSLRNTFRKRGRLILALIMLTIGGASFTASLGAAASWNKTIDKSFVNINYDIDIRLGGQYPADTIENQLESIPGVKAAEAWGYGMSNIFPKYSDGTYGSPYAIFAPKNGSTMITPAIAEGRWLQKGDTNSLVLDTEFIDNAEKLGTPVKVGDNLTLNIGGKDTVWKVVGIMDKIGLQSAAYVNYDYFSHITNQTGNAMCARVLVDGRDKDLQKAVTQRIEKKFAQNNISLFTIQPLTVSKQVVVNHVILILALLMMMSVMVAAVGALGLASIIGTNVMERTREIGIMRSIGATGKAISVSVVMEGVFIGILSWVLSIIVSIPLTGFIARNTGQFIFPRVMAVEYPIWAPALWLLIVTLVSALAGYYPARKATRLTIREVLTYE
ncbi:MAG: ABC transporter permease [Bacillota bacterium]|nr:ABC transporter permease [Bacillota bacterium]